MINRFLPSLCILLSIDIFSISNRSFEKTRSESWIADYVNTCAKRVYAGWVGLEWIGVLEASSGGYFWGYVDRRNAVEKTVVIS